jgi:hypothetical protein
MVTLIHEFTKKLGLSDLIKKSSFLNLVRYLPQSDIEQLRFERGMSGLFLKGKLFVELGYVASNNPEK